MSEALTNYFGTVSYDEDSVLFFPLGLPGFEDHTRFLLVEQPINKPLVFLQSLAGGGPCFVTASVTCVQPDFRLQVSEEDLRTLGLASDRQPIIGSEVACLAVISLAENRPPTANLMSPLVINLRTRCGIQAVQTDSGYSYQHPLSDPLGELACL